MKKIILIISLVFLLAGCTAPDQKGNDFRQISMKEAASIMEEENQYSKRGNWNGGNRVVARQGAADSRVLPKWES